MTDTNALRRPPQRCLTLIAALLLGPLGTGACTDKAPPAEPQPITRETACALDGMLLADYPGPKAQILYADQGEPDFFCDTMELFATVLAPEQKRPVSKIFVQDMGKADWQSPEGHWIEAQGAFYVVGSKMHGSMGPTFGSFASETDAADFARLNGGKVMKFSDITPDMADLNSGMSHDQSM